jgi:uncharacterized membrane protein
LSKRRRRNATPLTSPPAWLPSIHWQVTVVLLDSRQEAPDELSYRIWQRSEGAPAASLHNSAGSGVIFLAVLIVATGLAAAIARQSGPRTWARVGIGAAFVVAGVAHLVAPAPFEQHLPTWIPAATALVVLSGLVEIALGVALVMAHREPVHIGWGTAAYLIVVWPANVFVAVAGVDVDGQPGGVYPWVRVPLQVLFIAWALWATAAHGPERQRQRGGPRRAVLDAEACADHSGRPSASTSPNEAR